MEEAAAAGGCGGCGGAPTCSQSEQLLLACDDAASDEQWRPSANVKEVHKRARGNQEQEQQPPVCEPAHDTPNSSKEVRERGAAA